METQSLTQHEGHPPSTEVLGAPVHIIDVENVLRLMELWIRERDRTAGIDEQLLPRCPGVVGTLHKHVFARDSDQLRILVLQRLGDAFEPHVHKNLVPRRA